MSGTDETPADPRHGWLPAVVPGSARRYRTVDLSLAATLRAAGAELVDVEPDVELGPTSSLRGDAQCAIAPIDRGLPEGGSRAVLVLRRSLRSLAVRAEARRALAALRRLGYATVELLPWAEGEPLGANPLLPLAVLAVGRRAAAGTALDAAAAAAGVRLDAPAVVRQGIVVVLTDDAALRVALGPARGQIDAATAALELLRTLSPPPEVSERVPWLLADGETGLVRWSLERRLAGTKPGPLPLADCRAFLLALFHVGGDASAHRPDQNADVVAAACPDIADPIRDVAARAEESTASLARGFGHGDFWSDNLLVENGRLTGVVDWDAAGPGRLPLLDLLHLRANACRRRSLGVAIARDLLPWARRGGDDETRDFCAELGFATTPRLLEALVVAYWLDYVAYQLRLYADRSSRTQWLHANVVTVLDALQDADGRR